MADQPVEPTQTTDAEILDEAQMLARQYLLADDDTLTSAAKELKRRIAAAIVKECPND